MFRFHTRRPEKVALVPEKVALVPDMWTGSLNSLFFAAVHMAGDIKLTTALNMYICAPHRQYVLCIMLGLL